MQIKDKEAVGIGNPIPDGVAGGFPQDSALFDNGLYKIGVTPIGNDSMRGATMRSSSASTR